jgi:hypothetical protein
MAQKMNLCLFWVKTPICSPNYFGENIFKIITSVQGFTFQSWQTFLEFFLAKIKVLASHKNVIKNLQRLKFKRESFAFTKNALWKLN